jgi:hypothetical protein
MSGNIRPIYGTPKIRKSQSFTPIQFNIMSTMSELHRLMQEIKQDDLDILADIAYQQEQAMREGMDEPLLNNEQLNDSTNINLTN